MMLPLHRKPASAMLSAIIASFCLVMAGCSSTALPPGKSVLDVAQNKAQDPLAPLTQPVQSPVNTTGFDWEYQVLSAAGRGTAPEGLPAAQAELAATNSARVHALAKLQDQIRQLPVGTDQTVGSIMDTYLTIRHAVEQEIAVAPLAGQQPVPGGGIEVQVSMSMQNIAKTLQQYQITTDQELPAVNTAAPAGVPNII